MFLAAAAFLFTLKPKEAVAASTPVKTTLGDITKTTGVNEQVDYIARTLWGEARGEGYTGMQAVANVIMNRVKKGGWYGNTPKSVVTKPYQFSVWLKSDPNYSKMLSVTTADGNFKTAMDIAKKAYNRTLSDITGGATEYHTTAIKPRWDYSKLATTTTIGNHKFYKTV